MATVEHGLESQLRNIESTYGRPVSEWVAIIDSSGLRRHGQIVAMLKNDHGLAHGAANRLALVAMNRLAVASDSGGHVDPVDALYAGRPAEVRAIHNRVMGLVDSFGGGVEVSPKKGYLSLRRRVQFAMLKPAAKHLDVALVVHGEAATDRFESATTFNALFTHRVRVRSVDEVDDEFQDWLKRAFDAAA